MYGDLTFALNVQGRTAGLSRRILLDFASDIGLPRSAAEKVLDELLAATSGVSALIAQLPFDSRIIVETQRRLAYRRKLLATT